MYAPLEDKVSAYGELEASTLEAELQEALPPAPAASASPAAPGAAAPEDAEAAVSRLSASIRPAFAALHAAVERWDGWSCGEEAGVWLTGWRMLRRLRITTGGVQPSLARGRRGSRLGRSMNDELPV